ncbi:MAG: GDSL-type esterase/lipase family protein [Bacillus sp. (in: firmicutes)]
MKRACMILLLSVIISGCSLKAIETIPEDRQEEKQDPQPEAVQEEWNEVTNVDIKIATIGDSLTAGVGDDKEGNGYQSTLLGKLEGESNVEDVEFSRYGKRGLSSNGLIKKFDNQTIPPVIDDADAIIITIGGNDVMNIAKKNYRNLQMEQFTDGLDNYEKNIMKIIELIRENNASADIYFVGLYNPFQEWLSSIEEFDNIMTVWNQKTKDLAEQENQVYFVDISSIFQQQENLIYEEDYFHPNRNGYDMIGEIVYREIKKYTIPRLELNERGE